MRRTQLPLPLSCLLKEEGGAQIVRLSFLGLKHQYLCGGNVQRHSIVPSQVQPAKHHEGQITIVNLQPLSAHTVDMPTRAIATYARLRTPPSHAFQRIPILVPQRPGLCRCNKSRLFSSSTKLYRQQSNYKESFGTRLRRALRETKIKWYPIPVGVGIGFIGLAQLYRVNEREKARREEEWVDDGYVRSTGTNENGGDAESEGRPKRRHRVRPTGPWYVFKAMVNGVAANVSPGKSRLCRHCH